jgi:hypothetical protein
VDRRKIVKILREALDCGFWPLEDDEKLDLEFIARRLEEYADAYWLDWDEYLEELVIMSCLKLLEDELSEEGKKALRKVEEKWRKLGDKFWEKPGFSREEARRWAREDFGFNPPGSHWWWWEPGE